MNNLVAMHHEFIQAVESRHGVESIEAAKARQDIVDHRRVQAQLAHIEARLAALESALGLTPPSPVSAEQEATAALEAMGAERARQEQAAREALGHEPGDTGGP